MNIEIEHLLLERNCHELRMNTVKLRRGKSYISLNHPQNRKQLFRPLNHFQMSPDFMTFPNMYYYSRGISSVKHMYFWQFVLFLGLQLLLCGQTTQILEIRFGSIIFWGPDLVWETKLVHQLSSGVKISTPNLTDLFEKKLKCFKDFLAQDWIF